MYAEERRRQIASLTAIEGRVNVTELATAPPWTRCTVPSLSRTARSRRIVSAVTSNRAASSVTFTRPSIAVRDAIDDGAPSAYNETP